MSPALKSKSKDKSAAKTVKEHNKAPKSSVAPVNGLAATHDPVSGMFHALESDEQSGSSLGTAAEYDSVSNNDSCSGESEDHQKEKTVAGSSSRKEQVPGSIMDKDKREKSRQKNEKKHQRQKEKRAQELHERCCSYLTSRKLESLAQQLMAMGFTSEQATVALIHNEGRLEESALWLTEGGEESKRQASTNLEGVNPKINISDELARIVAMEFTFKCTKQEVERAVVACEGDLIKAEETLRTQKQETALAPSSDHASNKLATSSQNSTIRMQLKGAAPVYGQQIKEERDFNQRKPVVTSGVSAVEVINGNLQSARNVQQSKPDWTKPQIPVPLEKNLARSVPSPLQVGAAQAKSEPRYVPISSSDVKVNNTIASGMLREPITMMQRPQSNNTRTSIGLSASPPGSTGWYPSSTNPMEAMKFANGGLGQHLHHMSLNGSSSQQIYPQKNQQQFVSSHAEPTGWNPSWSVQGTTIKPSTSSLVAPSSLGLFSSFGSSTSSGLSSAIDWSTRGSVPRFDYASVDWSLDSTPFQPSLFSVKGELDYEDTWSTSYMQAKAANSYANGGAYNPMMQDGGVVADGSSAPAAGAREWTSPFGGKDIFRQFVSSPSP